MIDIFKEQIRSYAETSKILPGKPHCATIARWALKGRKGVRLESVVIGSRRFTSVEAIERFVARLNDKALPGAPRDTTQRARRDEDVERQLDAEGL
jgi:hypothetical protein